METTKTKIASWSVDPTHSEVQFKVRHLVISTVTGTFKKFSGTIQSENSDSFAGAKVDFSVDVNSIDTNVADRDAHLKSDDFFAADKHPEMKFKGQIHEKGENFVISGDLTIRGTTKKIELNAELGGIMEDPYGNTKAGFEITGKINRKEFGLNWSQVTEAGGIVVGDEVRMLLNLQFVKS